MDTWCNPQGPWIGYRDGCCGRFSGGFIHLVHGEFDGMIRFASKNRKLAALEGVQRFGLE